MLRSMYAGVSGMKGFQTKLDTIGNNIANVNTYGFKKGRTTFQDMMSQTMSGAQGPLVAQGGEEGDRSLGGINATQVGLGSQVGSVDDLHTQGNRQTTNRTLDLSIAGDGMFALYDSEGGTDPGNGIPDDANMTFSRAGNFYLDSDGALVNGDGKYVVGRTENDAGNLVAGSITIPNEAQSFSVQSDGTINYVNGEGETEVAGRVMLANFSNPAGLLKVGGNEFQNTDNAGWTDAGDPADLADGELAINGNLLNTAGQNGTGTVVSGSLEMSNVDLADEFTEMITAQRGFQANTRIITTSDEILNELINLKR
ncbi:flagellar basal body rod protein FlgG [Salimicrobium flavidum]|uniref:Flagellar hook protein FlgE n=1 Tax=Salimicrobium flavidum TaxID=570947 RepID=A0A1N7IKL7_9BACI|nr:flagellar basal body rod protein FlgG [Salimicrobium flavidum]SIS37629.1 flagellar hook protein FlgE [Salimicrobium flavidum]